MISSRFFTYQVTRLTVYILPIDNRRVLNVWSHWTHCSIRTSHGILNIKHNTVFLRIICNIVVLIKDKKNTIGLLLSTPQSEMGTGRIFSNQHLQVRLICKQSRIYTTRTFLWNPKNLFSLANITFSSVITWPISIYIYGYIYKWLTYI